MIKYFVDFTGKKKKTSLKNHHSEKNARFKPAPDFYSASNFLWKFESEGNFLGKEAQRGKQNKAPPKDVQMS